MKLLVTLKKKMKIGIQFQMMWMKIKNFQKNIKEVWDGIKKKIETINGGKKVECSIYFKKIKFESDDDFPMSEPVKLHLLTIIIRSVFSKDGKFYPQLFLDDALYDV